MSDRRIYEGQIRDQLATGGEHSKRLLQRFSGEFFKGIEQALLEDGHVRLHRFGSFKLQWSRARRGRHPQTGEIITIPAQPRVLFTPAKALREKVNAGDEQADAQPQAMTPPVAATPTAAREQAESTPVRPGPTMDEAPAPPVERTPLLPRAGIALVTLVTLLAVFWIAYQPSPPEPLVEHNRAQGQKPPHAQTREAEGEKPEPPPSRSDGIEQNPPATLASTQEDTDAEPPLDDRAAIADRAPASSVTVSNEPFFRERPHRLKNGDSLWRLSDRHYINPFYWPHIYQANRNTISNPNKLLIGRTIQLPRLEGKPGELTEADKRHIAEGYFLAYRHYKKHDRPYPYYALLGAQKFDPSVIERHIYEIDEKDWENLQLASN